MKLPDLTKVSTYDNEFTLIIGVVLVAIPAMALLALIFGLFGLPGPAALVLTASKAPAAMGAPA